MPAITSGKVLVTGANGYIAVWIVKSLLEANFAVRGTVRSESKAAYLRSYFKSSGDKFEVVVVPDMTKARFLRITICRRSLLTHFWLCFQDDAFAEHVKDVDAIAHTASPFHMNTIEPEEIVGPAVAGTLSVLKAAEAHGTRVQRVVVLSSTAALFRISPEPVVLDESAWNEQAIAEIKEKGRDATAISKYRASKTLAERAAWEWWEQRKAALGFDLAVLNPPYVFGPNIHDVDKPENLGESMRDWYKNVVTGGLSDDALAKNGYVIFPLPPAGWPCLTHGVSMNRAVYVDVRDIAQAHTLAIQTPAAGGKRFIISSGPFKWQDFGEQ